jgi:hypothetical protein
MRRDRVSLNFWEGANFSSESTALAPERYEREYVPEPMKWRKYLREESGEHAAYAAGAAKGRAPIRGSEVAAPVSGRDGRCSGARVLAGRR